MLNLLQDVSAPAPVVVVLCETGHAVQAVELALVE